SAAGVESADRDGEPRDARGDAGDAGLLEAPEARESREPARDEERED
ncbi:hypothetical protein GTY57_00370, partial [Streptomyces sp. SID5475]|nr:hypothetical protein [Streptomyces sp. SID5475]